MSETQANETVVVAQEKKAAPKRAAKAGRPKTKEFDKADIVTRAKAMRKGGHSISEIAKKLNEKGFRTSRGKKFTPNWFHINRVFSAAPKVAQKKKRKYTKRASASSFKTRSGKAPENTLLNRYRDRLVQMVISDNSLSADQKVADLLQILK